MSIRLLSSGIWAKITAATKKQPRKCHVAVAYFGTGAKSLLPLQEGSTLVVDVSESAVRSGQTNPSEILALIKKGVRVHSVRNLHAKVFVIGRQAFIGSTNVSNNSADGLLEAAVRTDNPSVVAACRRFVKGLQGELVTPHHARNLAKIYNPPKFGKRSRAEGKKSTRHPRHSPLWLVPLEVTKWDEEDFEAEKKGLPIAKKRLRSSRSYFVEDFCWQAGSFPRRLHQNDLVLQVLDKGKRIKTILPPSRAVYVKHYRKGRTHCAIVYLERLKRSRGKNLKHVQATLGREATFLGQLKNPKNLRDVALSHAMLNLWSSGNSK